MHEEDNNNCWLVAIKLVEEGEELTYSYSKYFFLEIITKTANARIVRIKDRLQRMRVEKMKKKQRLLDTSSAGSSRYAAT